jgi:hypothetical protein
MRLSELIRKRRLTRFSSAVPLLTDVYVAAHNWNADDYIGEVYKRKREYVVYKLLILNINNKKFDGNVRYNEVFDDDGYPIDDPATGEQAKELDFEKSDVNLIELIKYMVNELQEIAIIPDELLIAAGIEPPKHSVLSDPSATTLPQKEFIDAIEIYDTSNQPKAIENADIECNSSSATNTDSESKPEQVPELSEDTINQKYCFIKHGQSWNIQFGDIWLPGLKHMTGMDYIKILLQRPYLDVGVIDIQVMLNPEINMSSKTKMYKDNLVSFKDDEEALHYYSSNEQDTQKTKLVDVPDDYEEDAEGIDSDNDNTECDANYEKLKNGIANLSVEDRAKVTMLYRQLEEQKSKLEDAKRHNDTIEVSRLTAIKSMIEEEMYNKINARSDDPELGRNRKKVYKNIENARKNIQSEEISRGYSDTPVYNYLKEFIETGSTCKYNPLANDPIYWIF